MRKVEEKGTIAGREGKDETFPWKELQLFSQFSERLGWKRTLTAYMEETNGGQK